MRPTAANIKNMIDKSKTNEYSKADSPQVLFLSDRLADGNQLPILGDLIYLDLGEFPPFLALHCSHHHLQHPQLVRRHQLRQSVEDSTGPLAALWWQTKQLTLDSLKENQSAMTIQSTVSEDLGMVSLMLLKPDFAL